MKLRKPAKIRLSNVALGKKVVPFSHSFTFPAQYEREEFSLMRIALALLILSVPNAYTQQITSHILDQKFDALGVVGNKKSQGTLVGRNNHASF